MAAKNEIVVLLQQSGNKLHPASREAAAAATQLAAQSGGQAIGVLLCSHWEQEMGHSIKRCGLVQVHVMAHRRFSVFLAEEQTEVLHRFLDKREPEVLLIGATPEGRTLASMVAAKMKTGVTADCTALHFREDGLLVQTRPAYGGNIMADIITPSARPQIATVRYGATQIKSDTVTELVFFDMPFQQSKGVWASWAEKIEGEEKTPEIIFALGGGLKQKEDIQLFLHAAKTMGAALMCSRSLVERGWFSKNSQIGLSGYSPKAKLLVAFGVSGSVQFMAGVQNIEKICAVNIEECAPILKAADIPLLADMYEVVHEL